jgi:hypothetical protein
MKENCNNRRGATSSMLGTGDICVAPRGRRVVKLLERHMEPLLGLGSRMKIPGKIQFRARGAAWICFLVVCMGFSTAQQPTAYSQTPTFRVQSSLVLVDVMSQDLKSGLPIQDFKKDDFRVFDNGHQVPISTFDAGARYDTRPITLWLVVICNESGLPKFGASAEFLGQESLFRPALDHLESHDMVGVAHWCDNGDSQLDLLPTDNRDMPIHVLSETLKPISFEGGSDATDEIGEKAFRKIVRLIIRDAYQRNPKPLPVIVFLHGDHTGQPHGELNKLVDDFLETSGIVFGIRNAQSPDLLFIIGEQAKIMHYMAKHTGGEYFSVPASGYEAALEAILLQLHLRYELGFIPPAIDGKRHELRVELTKSAKAEHKGSRLRYRPEYIPVREEPEWTH